MMFFILISGKIGSGKSTISKELYNYYKFTKGLNVIERNFADELKLQCSKELNLPIELFYCQNSKNKIVKNNKTIGEYLQLIGAEERSKNENHWIEKLFTNVKNEYPKPDIVIISDVRFKNEIEYCKTNCLCYSIRLNGDPNNIRKNSKRDLTHISEIDLDEYEKFDIIIDTNKNNVNETVLLINSGVSVVGEKNNQQ